VSISIKKGEMYFYLDDQYVILSVLDFEMVLAENVETGEKTTLKIDDLGRTKLIERKDATTDLSKIPAHKLENAKRRLEAILPIINANSRREVEQRSKETGISTTTLYAWLKAYESTKQLTSLLFDGKATKRNKRVPKDQEAIIGEVINEFFLSKLKPTAVKTLEEISLRCKRADIEAPSISTIRRRISEIKRKTFLGKREGKKAEEAFEPITGEFPDGNYPLHTIEIDHTRVDIILVDETHRIELGRPWITLAIDVYSRMVAGFYISMESPGYFATGQVLANAICSKKHIEQKYSLQTKWPLWGVPVMIHMDNAGEFRGDDIQRVSDEYGIGITWRPVAKPRFGAHIERLIGTLNEDIHTLDGTTLSNVKKRGEYDSSKHACMTLDEFEEWLTVLITQVYHNKVHSSLGKTPLERYTEGIFGSKTTPPRGLPPMIEDEYTLRINLLPSIERTIQKYGILVDNICYYSNVLSYWIGETESNTKNTRKKKFTVRIDPRDVSKLYFYDPNAKTYYQIPYRNMTFPKASIWEVRAAIKHLKNNENREYNESEIFAALERLRSIAIEAKNKTKTHRKNMDRVAKVLKVDSHIPKTKIEQGVTRNNEDESVPDFLFENIEPFDGIVESGPSFKYKAMQDGKDEINIVDESEPWLQ